ncbi:MAG TPA: hypothetical protein VKZ49_17540 [Polyangiaceae bacterium]|nr:hypothetical protein [Polyangiaceae bacterium]
MIATKAAVSALVLASGFRAISDDDYARVVIAQRFVEAPTLDPSGTSWLPLPFLIQGVAMAASEPSLEVARAVSFVLGVLSALLLWRAATFIGLSRSAAVLAAILACALPYSARLGVATVPEAWTAALVVFGAASAARGLPERWWGAVALLLATLSRYESWPVAAVFCVTCAWDARRARAFWGPAAVAGSGIGAWLLHGVVRHGDALFFVRRVADYRRALGGSDGVWERLWRVPEALVVHEPEVLLFATAALLAGVLLRRPAPVIWWRFALPVAAVLPFLMAGELADGAPTHHGERAVLAVWMLAAVIGVGALERAATPARSLRSRALLFGGVGAVLLWSAVVPLGRPPAPFVDRSAEEDIGQRARRLAVRHVRVDTADFGYFAVLAALGHPSTARPLDDRDPRRERSRAFASASELGARLAGARWLVARKEHLELASALGRVRAENARFVLVQVAP